MIIHGESDHRKEVKYSLLKHSTYNYKKGIQLPPHGKAKIINWTREVKEINFFKLFEFKVHFKSMGAVHKWDPQIN